MEIFSSYEKKLQNRVYKKTDFFYKKLESVKNNLQEPMNEEEKLEIWHKAVIKAWKDAAFKEKLLKNPKKVLEELGLHFPKGEKIEIVENTQDHVYLHLPHPPSDIKKLSPSELEAMIGGKDTFSELVPKASKAIGGWWCPC